MLVGLCGTSFSDRNDFGDKNDDKDNGKLVPQSSKGVLFALFMAFARFWLVFRVLIWYLKRF